MTKAEYEERKSGEISAPSDAVKTPLFLTKKEQRIFEELSQMLIDIGVMTNLDSNALGAYIKAVSNYEKAVKQLDRIRLSFDKKKDMIKEEQELVAWHRFNTQHKIVVRCEKEMKLLGAPFGLDPLSRCKLVIPKKDEDKPKNKFLKHG